MNLPPCPRCGTPIQADWDSCQNCGLTADELAAGPPSPTPESGPESPRLLAAAGQSPRPSGSAGPGQFPGVDVQGPGAPMGYPGGHPGQVAPKPRTSTAAIVGMVVLGVVIVGAISAFALVMLAGEPKDRFSEVGPAIDDSPAFAAPEPEWQTFTAPDGRFSIDFSGEPTESSDTVEVLGVDLTATDFAVTSRSGTYIVQYIQAADGVYWGDPDAGLRGVFDSFESASDTPTNPAYFDFVGNPAAEAVGSIDGNTSHLFALFAGDRAYLIEVTAPGAGDPEGFERMKNSLQLLG